MYAYIDESGNSGHTKNSTKYFVVACILVSNETILPRIAKKVFKSTKLGKLGKNQLHATSDSDRVKLKIVSLLKKENYNIEYVKILKKTGDKDCYIESLLKLKDKLDKHHIDIVYIANKDSRKKTIDKIKNTFGDNTVLSKPEKEKGLQIADFVSWSIYQKYENGNSAYYDILFS